MKKLAVIRSSNGTQCPYGLSVDLACKNAGDSVLQMEPLERVGPERQQLQREHNIAVYSMYGNGRCRFADKLLANKSVHCDFGEGGAGIRDTPMFVFMNSPRVYQGAMAGASGSVGYHSWPLGSYLDGSESANVFPNVYTYAASGRLGLNRSVWYSEPDKYLLEVLAELEVAINNA